MKLAYVYNCPLLGWRWLCHCHMGIGSRACTSWREAYDAADSHVRGAA